MILRNKECLRPSIKQCRKGFVAVRKCAFGKEPGRIQWTVGLFFLLYFVIFLNVLLQIDSYRVSALYLEDALAASNLASAVIDLREYGRTHTIRIPDKDAAYERYLDALRYNLQLDEHMTAGNEALIGGTVTVERYIIYQVTGDSIIVQECDKNGIWTEWEGSPGAVQAPGEIEVESTGIYSEISFPVKGLFGTVVQAQKGKLVDIVDDTIVS